MEEFNLMDAANELTSEDNSTEPSSEVATESVDDSRPDEGSLETRPQEEGEEIDALKMLNDEKDDGASKFDLESINALGAVHNGTPVNVESPEQLKDLIEMGTDYRYKTMSY